MPQGNISTANYAAVIADLRAKRDELDRVISLLETMAQLNSPSNAIVPSVADTQFAGVKVAILDHGLNQRHPKALSNDPPQGIGERCVAILREHGNGKPMSTRQVTDTLLASGFPLEAKNPFNNVWAALTHRAKVSRDVIRAGRDWQYVGAQPSAATTANGYEIKPQQ